MKTKLTNFAVAAWLSVLFGDLATCSCLSQGTVYRNRSAFDATVSTLVGVQTDVNFVPPFPPGGMRLGDNVIYDQTLNISGLTFRGGGPLVIRVVSDDGNRVLNNYDSLIPLSVDMNTPTLAFGADFASLLTPFYTSFLAIVTLNDGRVFTFTAPADPNFTFWGIVTTQPFSTLTFSDGGIAGTPPPLHEEILDNITVVSVPEPGTCTLLALGALLLGWRLHTFRKP